MKNSHYPELCRPSGFIGSTAAKISYQAAADGTKFQKLEVPRRRQRVMTADAGIAPNLGKRLRSQSGQH